MLGLVKAQEVKNAVIVPSGAKGGFVCKQLPDPADREAYQGEVLACYRTFISAMLDITDNVDGERVCPPRDVVRHDGDDPYLVVAADKGTATFSTWPTRSRPATGSGWATCSPPAARRATTTRRWASPRAAPGSRSGTTFATLGMNPATDEFTVAGIGDMSGDVFGNGMLLSPVIKLVAASTTGTCSSTPTPIPPSASPNGSGCSRCPARPGRTTTGR